MEQYIFWGITTLVMSLIALLKYNINRTMNTLDKVKEVAETNKESMLKLSGRLDLIENNHDHLSEKFDQLYLAIRDLTIEMKELTRELSKKKM